MNDIIFRPVALADLNSICGFPKNEIELFSSFPKAQYPLTIEQLKQTIKERMASSVIEKDGRVIAYANLYDYINGEFCFIGNVFVSPDCRRQGIGEEMIRYMMSQIFDYYGFRDARVSCFAFNEQAMRLYKRIGFVEYDSEFRKNRKEEVELIHLQYDLFRYLREVKKGKFTKDMV